MADEAKMFLLVPENFEELSKLTGVSPEYFEGMMHYDEDFGFTSKIYTIPEVNQEYELVQIGWRITAGMFVERVIDMSKDPYSYAPTRDDYEPVYVKRKKS